MVKLSEAVDYVIYSPGSDSAIPVSILSSLKAPTINWGENKEMLREAISSTVTALLELVGFKNIDPVRSREHILLANIFENAWSKGEDLDLESMILQVQTRLLKNWVSSRYRSFIPKRTFRVGDAAQQFYCRPIFRKLARRSAARHSKPALFSDGKPKHSVFYLAHLADAERMFYHPALFRHRNLDANQAGTSDLRALVYFDEIVGYLPPVANPPSKPIILRMLKQARAFGLGMVLSTQNPIDLDYKALSNTGTWIIGKLQTDQDKQRLLDGLTNVSGSFDRSYFDNAISSLGKRVFLLHSVHAKGPEIFTTRWAMNYLPGPITRDKLADLNHLVGADLRMLSAAQNGSSQTVTKSEITGGATGNMPGKATEPVIGSKVPVFYLPVKKGLGVAYEEAAKRGIDPTDRPLYHYRPALIGKAQIWYANRSYNVNSQEKLTVLLPEMNKRGLVQWQDFLVDEIPANEFEAQPLPGASFAELSYPFDDEKNISSLASDFTEWLYRNRQLTLYRNPDLKIVSEAGESKEDFINRSKDAGSSNADKALEAIQAKFAKQKKSIEDKLLKEELELIVTSRSSIIAV